MKTEFLHDPPRVCVRAAYAPLLIDRFRLVPGREYDPATKTWWFPAVRDVLLMLCDATGTLPLQLPAALRDMIEDAAVPAVPPPDLTRLDGHTFLTEPFAHQRVNLARLMERYRWLLSDECGTGKSFAIVNRLAQLLAEDEELPILIVCPKTVMPTWRNQLKQHGNLDCLLIEGAAENRRKLLHFRRPAVKVVNWELLIHDKEALEKIKWMVLVADELHRAKSYTSQTCRTARKLSGAARYAWGLTGTPAPNGLEDWFGVLSVIDPGLLPVDTKTAFDARYCVKARLSNEPGNPMYNVWKVTSYRNVHELHGFVRSVTSRVTKADALDLPPKLYSTRTVHLRGDQARVYGELKKHAVANLKSLKAEGQLTVSNVIVESLRLLQVIGGFVPDNAGHVHELVEMAKLEALADVIEERGDKQLVVWCAFRPEVDYLALWLEREYGGGAVTLHGGKSQREREEAVRKFRGGEARWFIGTAAAGGTGLDGLQVCDGEVFYSRNWNLVDYLQSQDRLHRVGSCGENVTVYKLVAAQTVDVKVDDALERKASVQEMFLADPEDML